MRQFIVHAQIIGDCLGALTEHGAGLGKSILLDQQFAKRKVHFGGLRSISDGLSEMFDGAVRITVLIQCGGNAVMDFAETFGGRCGEGTFFPSFR